MFHNGAAEELVQNNEEHFDVSYQAYLICSHMILAPYQLGLIATTQAPQLPLQQVLQCDLYAFAWVCDFLSMEDAQQLLLTVAMPQQG